jgi:hypothetical protein
MCVRERERERERGEREGERDCKFYDKIREVKKS